MTARTQTTTTRRSFWTVAIFYLLIAFELFYMASPFAIYFYAVYGPGLNFINGNPALALLGRVLLPHIVVETANPIINLHDIVGGVLAVLGFAGFCIGAAQVYYHKLFRKGAVLGGIYNVVRHPQYASLAVCGFGMLLLWPRYIVLLSFLTMLFAYYFLARAEEMECAEKFGQAYLDYQNRMHMFLPFKVPFADRLPSLPQNSLARAAVIVGLYGIVAIAASDLNHMYNNIPVPVY